MTARTDTEHGEITEAALDVAASVGPRGEEYARLSNAIVGACRAGDMAAVRTAAEELTDRLPVHSAHYSAAVAIVRMACEEQGREIIASRSIECGKCGQTVDDANAYGGLCADCLAVGLAVGLAAERAWLATLPVEDITDEDGDAGTDVRFQLVDGNTYLHTGDVSGDNDGRGHWAAGFISVDADVATVRMIAVDLVNEALDARAEASS